MNQVKNSMRIVYPSNEDFHVVCSVDNTNNKSRTLIILRKITEKQSEELSNGEVLLFNHGDKSYEVSKDECYAFGEINLNDEEDLNLINSFKWQNSSVIGHNYPVNYDYKTHTGDSFEAYNKLTQSFVTRARFGETFDNVKLFKFAHACIGKPKNVVAYGIKVARRII